MYFIDFVRRQATPLIVAGCIGYEQVSGHSHPHAHQENSVPEAHHVQRGIVAVNTNALSGPSLDMSGPISFGSTHSQP
jgi:hypothetical protein